MDRDRLEKVIRRKREKNQKRMLQCVFVNTEQSPTKIKRYGYFKVVKLPFSNEYGVTELCEVFYPHPDAPEHTLVSVFRFLDVEAPKDLTPAIEQANKAILSFRCVTKLSGYEGTPTTLIEQEN